MLAEPTTAETIEEGACPFLIRVLVLVPARRERGVLGRHDDLGRGHPRLERRGHCGRRERDALAQGSHVAATERLAEHLDRAPTRMLVERGDAQHGRLPRAVRT